MPGPRETGVVTGHGPLAVSGIKLVKPQLKQAVHGNACVPGEMYSNREDDLVKVFVPALVSGVCRLECGFGASWLFSTSRICQLGYGVLHNDVTAQMAEKNTSRNNVLHV